MLVVPNILSMAKQKRLPFVKSTNLGLFEFGYIKKKSKNKDVVQEKGLRPPMTKPIPTPMPLLTPTGHRHAKRNNH